MHLGWDEAVKAYVLMIFGSLYIYVVMMDEAFSVGMGWAWHVWLYYTRLEVGFS